MSLRSPRWRPLLLLLFSASLLLAPALAQARAGRSFSGGFSGIGSRGSRSFEYNGAQSITRSMSPTPRTALGYRGSIFRRHPFLSGLMGGFLGAWLFGHFGIGAWLGTLIELVILGFLIYGAARWLFGGRAVAAGVAPLPSSAGAAGAPRPHYRGTDTGVADSDLHNFEALHAAIQDAWSRGDLVIMRSLMTPEMLGYFAAELTKNTSRGVRNVIANVRLLKGEVSEAWEEGDVQYATAYMRWSARDYLVKVEESPGAATAIVSGDPSIPVEAEEVWTFVRSAGGRWLLSAIQQV